MYENIFQDPSALIILNTLYAADFFALRCLLVPLLHGAPSRLILHCFLTAVLYFTSLYIRK